MKQFNVFFDGGCKPNPGRGYGSFEIVAQFQFEHGVRWSLKRERIDFGQMTNNMAEYQALCCALEALFQETLPDMGSLAARDIYRTQVSLAIVSDSQLLVNHLNNGWKIKSKKLIPFHDCVRHWLKQFGHWDVRWKPRAWNVARFGH